MSDTEPNLISALLALLGAEPHITGTVDDRIFGGRIPKKLIASDPRPCIVVRAAGGGGNFGGGWQEYGDKRVDVLAYALTPHDASAISATVHRTLKQMTRQVQAGVRLHWCRPSSEALSLEDTATEWPYSFSSWQVLAGEITVT